MKILCQRKRYAISKKDKESAKNTQYKQKRYVISRKRFAVSRIDMLSSKYIRYGLKINWMLWSRLPKKIQTQGQEALPFHESLLKVNLGYFFADNLSFFADNVSFLLILLSNLQACISFRSDC